MSIFSCDEYAVFSNAHYQIIPGVPVPGAPELRRLPGNPVSTSLMNSSMMPMTGTGFEVVLNSNIFMKAWEAVQSDGRYQRHDWVVKVDPDAVFFPHRLKDHLRKIASYPDANMYLLNCKESFGFFGSLEVISRRALHEYIIGTPICKVHLEWQKMGEDLWMRKCMDYLRVSHQSDYGLLSDGYCKQTPSPCGKWNVAFHPFKTALSYMQCVKEATASFV